LTVDQLSAHQQKKAGIAYWPGSLNFLQDFHFLILMTNCLWVGAGGTLLMIALFGNILDTSMLL
jgi:hypothetical protein